jgi:hypothetical protein
MGKMVKNVFGALMGGGPSKGQKQAQQQAQQQQQVSQIAQQQAVNEQSRQSATALGQVTRRRRGSRLLDADQGKATLG